MNALYKNINWNIVDTVGFDMDGTLYDEYDFIKQVYFEINTKLINDNNILDCMLMRWIKEGSSYPYIFDEAYNMLKKKTKNRGEFIRASIDIYRNYNPKLSLSNRNMNLLKFYKNNYSLFLISDGNYHLQKKKYNALGLANFFDSSNVVFTGKYSSEYCKPNIKSLSLISVDTSRSMFFGDRDVDMNFAITSNMQFQKVYNMIEKSS